MNLRHVLNVVKGDLWGLLKERAYLKKLLLMPLVIIPFSLLAVPLAMRMVAQDTATSRAVLAVDQRHPLPEDLRRVLEEGLPSARGFEIQPTPDPVREVRERRAAIGLRYTPEKIEIIARNTTVTSAGMTKRLATLLNYYQARLAAERYGAKANPVLSGRVAIVNAATPAERALGGMAFLIPMIVVMWLLNTVENVALEITVGEREKGLFETLLLTPVSPRSVAFGKVLAATLVGFFASIAAWLGLVATGVFSRFVPQSNATFSDIDVPIGGQIMLTPWGTFAFLLVMTALGLLFAGAILWYGMQARTLKEAHMRLTGLGLAVMASGAVLQFSDQLAANLWVYLIPGLNGVVAVLEAAKATLSPTALLLTVAVNLALAGLLAFLAARKIAGDPQKTLV